MADRLDIANIFVNFLKKARYERLIAEDELEEDQFYATTDGNEKTEYGDLFGNIEDQADLFNALYSSRIFTKAMCDDPRGYAIVKALKNSSITGLEGRDGWIIDLIGSPDISDLSNYTFDANNYLRFTKVSTFTFPNYFIIAKTLYGGTERYIAVETMKPGLPVYMYMSITDELVCDYSVRTQIAMGVAPPEYSSAPPFCSIGDDFNGSDYTTYFDLNKRPLDLTKLRAGVNVQNSYPVIQGYKYDIKEDTYPEYNILIPYYHTKDGVKIVDIQYKDRVDQLYNLTGQGNYIIIDEANEEFRLPLPDIYSQLENKSSFILRKWED